MRLRDIPQVERVHRQLTDLVVRAAGAAPTTTAPANRDDDGHR